MGQQVNVRCKKKASECSKQTNKLN